MTPHPHPHPHPWHPVHQRRTTHAVAVHRPNRPRCTYPDRCTCPACRNRWLLVLGGAEGERWASRYAREQGEWMARALWLLLGTALAAGLAWHMYVYLTTGGAQL